MTRAALALALALFASPVALAEEPSPLVVPSGEAAEEPAPLASDPLAALARSEKRPLIADFGLNICSTCKQQKKVLDNVAKDYRDKVSIRFVHVSHEAPIADYHGVTEIPTLLFYNADGSIARRQVGGLNYLQIADELEKMGVKP